MVNPTGPAVAGELVKLPRGLVESAALGNCVGFVGAGFSRVAGMPGWRELLEILLSAAVDQVALSDDSNELAICKQCIDAGEFEIAASGIREILHISDVSRIVSREYREHRLKELSASERTIMDHRMRSLARGPWAGIITTNYDTLIEVALRDACSKPVSYVLTPDADLGLALNRNSANSIFFVKIHGTINAGKIVLTADEYDDTYLKSSKVKHFLMAAMMSYNFVFIGSSVESELLRVRQQLCVDYGGGVPVAYALMPASDVNLRRSRWLLKHARLQVIFYPSGRHEALSEFLDKLYTIEVQQTETLFPSTGQMSVLRRLSSQREKLLALGSINLVILSYIKETCFGVISKEQILRLSEFPPLPAELARMSRDEIFYRIQFLVGCGLIIETQIHGGFVYEVND